MKLFKQHLKNTESFGIVWAKVWQLFDNGVYILSVKESKSRCVNSVDLYYKTPTAAKQAFKRYWGASIPDKAKWVVDVLNSTPNPDECDATKADKR